MLVDTGVLGHDMRYFAIAYALAIGAAFLPLEPVWLKWIVAVVLLGIYAWYVKGHFEADPDVDAEDLAPLRFHRLDRARAPRRPDGPAPAGRQPPGPRGPRADHPRGGLLRRCRRAPRDGRSGVDEVLLALVIAPIATELPEKFNSVIWVRQGKDTLAMGNITGAMVFQSTIPTVVALVFASATWVVGRGLATSPSPRPASRSCRRRVIFIPMARAGRLRGRGLLVGGVFYLAYLAVVVRSRVAQRRSAGGAGGPLIYSADRYGSTSRRPRRARIAGADPHAHREVDGHAGRRPPHHAPSPARSTT